MTEADPAAGPIGFPSDADWERLHGFELTFGECWINCNSYCCRTNHPQQEFALMKCNSAGMIFMPEEFAFLKRHGRLQAGFEKSHRHHSFVFDAARGLAVGFDTAVCDLGGICTLPAYRPMICKLYPYYPIVTPETGGVDDFFTGSIIDQYWAELGLEHPCWLHRTKSDAVKSAVRTAGVSFDHPYFVFNLGAAAIFARHVTARAKAEHAVLLQGDPRQFFRHWEIAYLTGGLTDRQVLCADLQAFHQRVEAKYGPFVL